jgi:dihydroflavonol-4-reductase
MAGAKKLVTGASGFLGSHVTRQLVDRGDDVRVLIRTTSSTKAIEDLNVDYHYGDIFDDAAVRTAMAGCDDVFCCDVDPRAWLRDPAPLFRTNVDGLRHVLDAAVDADLRRFVFTSTIGTIGIPAERRAAPEEDEFNWADKGGAYVVSRVEAENLVMRYGEERGPPAVLCVSNTYGPRDWQPTLDHGKAERELGWQPGPVHDPRRRAAQFFRENRRRSRRRGRKQVAHYACPQRVPA